MYGQEQVTAIIMAAGTGSRMGAAVPQTIFKDKRTDRSGKSGAAGLKTMVLWMISWSFAAKISFRYAKDYVLHFQRSGPS